MVIEPLLNLDHEYSELNNHPFCIGESRIATYNKTTSALDESIGSTVDTTGSTIESMNYEQVKVYRTIAVAI